ncbi:hypothetical protein [Mucilaginibacter koreensis]
MKRINLTQTTIAAVAAFAFIFTLSAGLHIYHLTLSGLIDWTR